MKLVCPSCESSFLVDASAIGLGGRKVRCGRCGNSWLARAVEVAPEDPPAAPEGPPDDLPVQPAEIVDQPGGRPPDDLPVHPAETVDQPGSRPPDDLPVHPAETVDQPGGQPPSAAEFETARRRSRRAPGASGAEAHRRGSAGGWLLFALVTGALVAGVALGRQQIMDWAPETRSLYAMAGIASESPLPSLPRIQLKLRDVTSDRKQVDGTPSLVIQGEVFNPTDETQDVPPLVATLMDPTGIELKRWVFAAETESLPPGGHATFHTSTRNPPGQGNLNLNFVPHRR
jgi:predicted Zn finger-like uncharacterized protein